MILLHVVVALLWLLFALASVLYVVYTLVRE
jgi:hypothetical protein